MSTTPFLQVEGLTKNYGPTRALSDLTLDFMPGEIHALCGHNGAGKSTLVKMIAGIEQSDEGQIRVNGEVVSMRGAREAERLGVAFVQQELSVLSTLSIEENVLLGGQRDTFLSRSSQHRAEVRRVLEMVGLGYVDPAATADRLSAGEQQLVEIARGISRDAKLLILDEPTATLSDVEIERIFRVIRSLASAGTTIVFVSHRLGEVLSLCGRATVMRDGQLVATRSVEGLTRDELIDMMVGSFESTSSIDVLDETSTEVAVRIDRLAVPGRVQPFSLDLKAGEIVAIAGQVGAGASEVLRAIGGLRPDATGTVEVRGRTLRLGNPRRSWQAGVHFVSNDRKVEGLFLKHSAGSNLVATRTGQLSRSGVISIPRARAATATLAEDVRFNLGRLRDKAGNFSGGNQQKLFIGRVLRQAVTGLILLDEPTRGVDVKGRAEIHDLVRRAATEGCAVIFASTELDEILDLATTVVTMRAGAVVSITRRVDADATSILRDMTHAVDQLEPEVVR